MSHCGVIDPVNGVRELILVYNTTYGAATQDLQQDG